MDEHEEQFEELIVFGASHHMSNSNQIFHSNVHESKSPSRKNKCEEMKIGRNSSRFENWQADYLIIEEKTKRNDELESLVRKLEEENRIMRMQMHKMREDNCYLSLKGIKLSKMILDLLKEAKDRDLMMDIYRKAQQPSHSEQFNHTKSLCLAKPSRSIFSEIIPPKTDIELHSNREAITFEEGSFNLKILEELLKVEKKDSTTTENIIEKHFMNSVIELKGLGVDEDKLLDIIGEEKTRLINIILNFSVHNQNTKKRNDSAGE